MVPFTNSKKSTNPKLPKNVQALAASPPSQNGNRTSLANVFARHMTPENTNSGSCDTANAMMTPSDTSEITDISMDNNDSRGGSGGSPRRISSEALDQSQSLGDELRLDDCEEDSIAAFPLTRPRNPVSTNGLSIWKIWR